MMRALIVAPADVHAQLFGGMLCTAWLSASTCSCARLRNSGKVEIGVLDVATHGEIGTIDLQHEAGIGDGLVFVPHRIGDGVDVGLVVLVVVVAEEQRDDARARPRS